MAEAFADVLREQLAGHQFVVLGDLHHRTGIDAFLGQPDHMAAMASQGVGHLFIERGSVLEQDFAGYHKGGIDDATLRRRLIAYEAGEYDEAAAAAGKDPASSMTPETEALYGEAAASTFQLVRAAKAHGIQVHAVDNGAGNEFLDAGHQARHAYGRKVQQVMTQIIAQESPSLMQRILARPNDPEIVQQVQDFVVQYASGLDEAGRRQMQQRLEPERSASEKADAAFMKHRLDGDRAVAAQVLQVTGSGKGVILYGAAHGMHKDDLDDHLGQARSVRVLLASHAVHLDMLHPARPEDPSRGLDGRQAAGVYFINENVYVRNRAADIAAACAAPGIDTSTLSLCDEPEVAAARKPAAPPIRPQP